MRKTLLFLFFAALFCTFALPGQEESVPGMAELMAQNTSAHDPSSAMPNVVTQMAILFGFAILPFAVMLLTSFLKMVIVMSLMRSALGVQNSPPNQAIIGIAFLLTIYVMAPTGIAMWNASEEYMEEAPTELFSGKSAAFMVSVVNVAKEPLRQFLDRNTYPQHERYFYQLAYKNFPESYRKSLKLNDFIVLMPAFITSQIKAAFEIGVLIYLPFFVIDLVTSNILLAMGMMMLSPLTISLPLKLLLLVMVDGWTLVVRGLVLTYR